MIDYTKRNKTAEASSVSYDEGLRQHMLKVYNYMFLGLGLTGLISLASYNIPAIAVLAFEMRWVTMIGLIAMAFLVMPKMYTMSETGAKISFFGYAALLSFAISPFFQMYTGESIARTFFITSAIFGGMTLYGYTTKKDLTSIGTFAMIGIIGVFFAGLVNIFVQSAMIHFIASAVAVIAVIGLTAYDTQKIKQTYLQLSHNAEAASKAAIIGALQLYFDFVYMFIHLMQFFGERR